MAVVSLLCWCNRLFVARGNSTGAVIGQVLLSPCGGDYTGAVLELKIVCCVGAVVLQGR